MTEPERGAGLFSTLAGVTLFLTLLMFATQVLVNLHTATVVTAAAYDAARLRATAEMSDEDAEDYADELIGALNPRYDWHHEPDVVVLEVTAESPRFLIAPIQTALGFDTINRTVRIRLEEAQG